MKRIYYSLYFPLILISLISASCGSTKVVSEPEVHAEKDTAPVWITDSGRRSQFPDSGFISQLGTGASADGARQNAVGLISQFVSSSVKSLSEAEFSSSSENGEVSESYSINTSAEVASDNELYAVKYTSPYFSENENIYYCAAYIDKAECVRLLRPKLNNIQTEILSSMKKSDETEENFYKLLACSSVLSKKDSFYRIYDFYRIVNDNDMEEFSPAEKCFLQAERRILDLKDSTVISVSVTDDFNSAVYNAVCSVLNDTGFTVSKAVADYSLLASVTADVSETSGGIFESFPFCEIRILSEDGEPIHSLDIQCKKAAAFDEKTARSKAYKALENQIKSDFEKNLLSGI